MLHLGGDVDGGVESAATTEGSWPELATDMFSWACHMWKVWTALHWKESSGCAVLLASVSFEVGGRLSMVRFLNLENWVQTWTRPEVQGLVHQISRPEPHIEVCIQRLMEPKPEVRTFAKPRTSAIPGARWQHNWSHHNMSDHCCLGSTVHSSRCCPPTCWPFHSAALPPGSASFHLLPVPTLLTLLQCCSDLQQWRHLLQPYLSHSSIMTLNST